MERLITRLVRIAVCTLFVAACGPTATVITTPTPVAAGPPAPSGGSPTITPSPLPPPTVSVPPGSRWQLLSDFPTQNAYEVVSVVNTGSGFIAAGTSPAPGEGYEGRSQGLVWTSADGQNWQSVADPALLYTEPIKLAVLGNDQYVIGDYEPCSVNDSTCADSGKAGNTMFHSSGGGWTMLPQNPDLQNGFVDGMIAGRGQLLVYGGASDDAATTTVWRSSDGTNWASFAAPDLEQITAMTTTANGYLMFAATYNGSSDVQGVVARSSTDGSNFTPVALPDLSAFQYPEIDGLTTRGNSIVAVGYSEDDQGNDVALVLFSPDGTNWTVGHDTDGSFAGNDLQDVVAIDNGYLGFGYSYQSDSDLLTARVWYSADGQNWRQLPAVPGTFTDIDAWAASSQAAIYFTYSENDTSSQSAIAIYPFYASVPALLAP